MLWLVALILGWLLVEGQPSAGGQWTDPHILTLQSAHVGWFLQLLGLAFCLWGGGKRALDWKFLLVVALGAWLPMLVLNGPYFQIGPGAATCAMIAMGLMLRFRAPANEPRSENEDCPDDPSEALTLILTGAGMALALHGLGRILARLGEGSSADTSVTVATFITLVACGAFSFGRPIPVLASKRKKLLPWICFALMLAIIAALRAEQTLGTGAGLRTLMRRFGLDLSHAGTTAGVLLTSVSILILPAFAVGTLISALRQARRIFHVTFGAAVATLLIPTTLNSSGFLTGHLQPSLRLIVWGIGLLVIAETRLWLAQGWRYVACAAIVIGILITAIMPKDSILVPRPWQRTPVEPILWMELPQGQLTVTSDGMGSLQVLLDQVPLTADAEHSRLQDRCMAVSMGLLNAETRSKARVLLIGVLSPQVKERLHALGARHIDRVIPFDEVFGKACEQALIGKGVFQEIPGDSIDRVEARTRLNHGDYDLVLGLPTHGIDAPMPDLPKNPKAVMVLWNSLEGLQGTRHSDHEGILCSDGLARFAFAWTAFPKQLVLRSANTRTASLRNGGLNVSRLRWHTLRSWERTPLGMATSLDALSQDAIETDALLFGALQDIFSKQTGSSPFETETQRFELPREPVIRLTQALGRGPAGPFYQEIAGGLARTLIGKRDVASIMEFLPELSKSMGEPYELERSIARAELESLEPGAAAIRLKRLRQTWPTDVNLLEELGMALDQSEQPGAAVDIWAQLRDLHPDEWHFEKAWTLSLVRSDDDRASAALEKALSKHPDDLDLLAVSQSGPLPPIEVGFQPGSGRHEGHNEHE
ncbi:MAG: hypothetical protein GY930_14525 [bacterium]|nr:hypothetical protein [bacterium]